MSNTPSAPEPGQILAGKYLIEQVLGIGGMGVVVSAKHVQLEQKVAIKYLLPQALLNPEVVERFAREARAAAKIRGEHVARVIDVGQFDDGAPYMVMEHLDGHDLAKHLELYGPLPIEDACRFLLETCEALAEAHSAKIVHRDLKPSNMFLAKQPDKSAIIKVLDFGISKTGDAPSASLTKTSALMGTAFYMSPEQLTNPKGVDHRSDIWSLGVILFELLAGRQPFIGESVPEIIGGILQNQPVKIRELRADVPGGLEAIIVKCMQTKTVDRYQSVAGLAAALGAFANARDRQSVEITARVLNESIKPEAPSGIQNAPTMMMPPSKEQQTGPRFTPMPDQQQHQPGYGPSASALTIGTPQQFTPQQFPVTPPTTGPHQTAQGLSTSQITPKPKRSPIMLIAGVVGLSIAIGGTAIGVKYAGSGSKAEAPAAAATGLVAPPPDPVGVPPKATAANSAGAGGNGGTTLLPANPQPTTTAAAPADPPPKAPVATAAAPAIKPTAAGGPAVAAPAKSATAAAPTAAAPTAAAPTAAAAATGTPKNPLNMGIK
jgi:eukaryotic-like serine/threonine-protein kinase